MNRLFFPAILLAVGVTSTFADGPKGLSKNGKSIETAPATLQAADAFKFSGLSPEQAAKEMTLPSGFKAQLFAGEPDVKQPIAFAMDDRGRIWVAEAYTYPIRTGKPPTDDHAPGSDLSKPTEAQLKDILGGKDRIVVFEDTNGDGKFDKRTVFIEGLNLVSGLEVGFGGVWVGAAPYLMFIPMVDGDAPKPAGPPQIVLDGWGWFDTHETLNTFKWGPDGWLYGCHGVFTQASVGKPGTPDNERVKFNAGVWRYHPVKHRFELFAEGTSNPWGIDFNDVGQCITEACVIPHLWHMIQGGNYLRQAGPHPNPYVYDDIKTIADHVHYASKTPHAGNGHSASSGGGHAHAGLMVYLGGSWPEKYRGQAFMNNIHGARINEDLLEPQGSGYVGRHAPDFIEFNDLWSQIVNLQYDQDGSVYMIDWYDKNQCHNVNPNIHDRTNGRIFKIVYGDTKTTVVDLQKLSDSELVTLQLNKNDWQVRHARRILEERAQAGRLKPETKDLLRTLLGISEKDIDFAQPAWARSLQDEGAQLRLMWALHAIGGLDEADALMLMNSKHEHVRAWTVQLLCEDGKASEKAVKAFAEMARADKSPVVRLYVASAVQRIAPAQRWDIVAALHGHAEDATDHNLPLMGWYALEPLVPVDFNRALGIALGSKLPPALEFTSRRIVSLDRPDATAALASTLRKTDDAQQQLAILTGISAGLKGQRTIVKPEGWNAVEEKLAQSSRPEVRALAQSLSLTFGSTRALESMRRVLADTKADIGERRNALTSLLGVKDAALPPVLLGLLKDSDLRDAAIHGLANYPDEKIPGAVLAVYSSLPTQAEKRTALLTLASRAAFVHPLLAAMADGRIPAKDMPADIARNIRSLNEKDITEQLEKVWGSSRETPADKLALLAKYKTLLTKPGRGIPDPAHGRLIFSSVCMQCHTLFGEGAKIGPDLTGSNRRDLDYLLHNIVDPNAEIPNQYRAATVELKDGTVLTGIANQEDPKVVTIASAGTEPTTVPRSEIKSITLSESSLMPEGLLTVLTDVEIKDLIDYLRSPVQVPLPAGEKRAQK